MAGNLGRAVGASGLNAAFGQINEELHPNLSGRQAINTWRQMRDSDAIVGSILFAIEMLARQVPWTVERGDSTEEASEFLESCLDDMSESWGDFISEALSMLPYGFAFCEIEYKKRDGYQPDSNKKPSSRYDDGKIGWRKLPLRAQETLDRWEFEEDGGLKAFVQRSAPDYTDRVIPMTKGLLFRTTAYKNNPEGRSVLRSAYESWFYKKRIKQIEGTGIERDLAGFPVFWIPAEFLSDDASPEQKAVVASFTQMGKNIKRDKQEHIIMPLAYDANGHKAYDFTLMNSGGSRSFDTDSIISRYNKEIAMTVLADFILLGHDSVGSFALSSDKTDLFAVALGTFLDIITDCLNRFAVPRLFSLNGMPVKDLPRITHGDIEKPNLGDLGSYLGALTSAGVSLFPDEDLETYLRTAGNLPMKSEEAKKEQEEADEEAEANPAEDEEAQGDSDDESTEDSQSGADDGSDGSTGFGSTLAEARARRQK